MSGTVWEGPATIYGVLRCFRGQGRVAIVDVDLPAQSLAIRLTSKEARQLKHSCGEDLKITIQASYCSDRKRYFDARLVDANPYERLPNVLECEDSERLLKKFFSEAEYVGDDPKILAMYGQPDTGQREGVR